MIICKRNDWGWATEENNYVEKKDDSASLHGRKWSEEFPFYVGDKVHVPIPYNL